ncbi:hypothetical protein IWQ56_006635 [Coemansia nantahalensis]|uniref:Uncharacterized protein n=1 Tax=Coemansia nantahalensis TaxID=2789366 RepID=A0ACC1JS90_9FUNG|nr:hypothetical protein IWQ56_006635 [Coemansia nantahalensis]KAJ2766118.1 hypothetical protein IWQ57_004505 [Coemansia nantahalensis]
MSRGLARALLALAALAASAAAAGGALVERIVGGSPVDATTYPFAVRLSIMDGPMDYRCGGTLIADDLVVTAAHCIVEPQMATPFLLEKVNVCYGDSNVSGQTCTVALNTTVHPRYNPLVLTNDIALIRIAPVEITSTTAPAAVYTGKLPENTTLTTMGWGKTDSSSEALPSTLMSTDIVVGSPDTCREAQPLYRSADGPDVCTVNALTPGRDSCQGDSGSPTVIAVDGGAQLVALTSAGIDLSNTSATDCAMPNGLAIYTHIYYYIDFIASTSGRPQSSFTGSAGAGGQPADSDRASSVAAAISCLPSVAAAVAALLVASAVL